MQKLIAFFCAKYCSCHKKTVPLHAERAKLLTLGHLSKLDGPRLTAALAAYLINYVNYAALFIPIISDDSGLDDRLRRQWWAEGCG